MRGEFPQLLFGDAADAARGAQPEGLAVVGNPRHIVAQKAVFCGESLEFAVAIRVEPAAEGGDPQGPVGVEVERAHLIARKAIFRGELARAAAIDPPKALAVSSRPDRPAAVFAQRYHRVG